MWVKTDLPVPVIRGLEAVIRMAQILMKKPKQTQEPPKRVEFGTYDGLPTASSKKWTFDLPVLKAFSRR